VKVLWAALLICGVAAHGQTTIDTSAGGDQIYDAYGLKSAFTWHELSGWTGVGYNNGAKFGGYLRVPLNKSEANLTRQYHLDLGDQIISAALDTDDTGYNHSFSVRGVGVSVNTKTTHSQVFSGLLLQEFMLPYMHTGDTIQTPLVSMTTSRKVSDTLQWHSLNTYDGKVTSIESFGWMPTKSWVLSAAGGVGASQGYGAVAGEFIKKKVDLRTSYTAAGSKFQRQQTPYYSEEALGINARASYSPIEAVNLYYSHDHTRTNIVGYPSVTGVSDSGSMTATLAGFSISPAANRTIMDGINGQTKSESISVSREIIPRWRAFGSYINMDSPLLKEKVVVAVNEFRISSRLMVTQDFNRMGDQNTLSFGGHWISNRISLSAENETYVSPIATAFSSKPVFQAWTYSIRLRLPHGAATNLTSIVDPTGKVQWGGYLSGLKYNSAGPQHFDDTPSFSKYIVQGKAIDVATGLGIEGIAIEIGKDIVTSNSSGVFYLDVKNTKPMSVKVLASYSTQPFPWRLVSAPSVVQGRLEKIAEPIRIAVSTKRVGED
jgi:hypothetical protein